MTHRSLILLIRLAVPVLPLLIMQLILVFMLEVFLTILFVFMRYLGPEIFRVHFVCEVRINILILPSIL